MEDTQQTLPVAPAPGALSVVPPQSSVVVRGEFGTKELATVSVAAYEKIARSRIDVAQQQYRDAEVAKNELSAQLVELLQQQVDEAVAGDIAYAKGFYAKYGKPFKHEVTWSRTDVKVMYTLNFYSAIGDDYNKTRTNPFGPINESLRITDLATKELIKQLRAVTAAVEQAASDLAKAKAKLADSPNYRKRVEARMALEVLSTQPGYERLIESIKNDAESEFDDLPAEKTKVESATVTTKAATKAAPKRKKKS